VDSNSFRTKDVVFFVEHVDFISILEGGETMAQNIPEVPIAFIYPHNQRTKESASSQNDPKTDNLEKKYITTKDKPLERDGATTSPSIL
jgi:hypothetical protein